MKIIISGYACPATSEISTGEYGGDKAEIQVEASDELQNAIKLTVGGISGQQIHVNAAELMKAIQVCL